MPDENRDNSITGQRKRAQAERAAAMKQATEKRQLLAVAAALNHAERERLENEREGNRLARDPGAADRARGERTLRRQRRWLYGTLAVASLADMALILANPASSAAMTLFGAQAPRWGIAFVLVVLGMITTWALHQCKLLGDVSMARVQLDAADAAGDRIAYNQARTACVRSYLVMALGIVVISAAVLININTEQNKIARTLLAQRLQEQEAQADNSPLSYYLEPAKEAPESAHTPVEPPRIGFFESLPANTWTFVALWFLHMIIFAMPTGGAGTLDYAGRTPELLAKRASALDRQVDELAQEFGAQWAPFRNDPIAGAELRSIVPARVWQAVDRLTAQPMGPTSAPPTPPAAAAAAQPATGVPGPVAESTTPADPWNRHL
jgi:hypothetical protein